VAEKKKPTRRKKTQEDSYWASTHRPLQCLMFLLPLVILYEVGVVLYATEFVPGQGELPIHIVARTMLIEFFSRLQVQVPGMYLPGLIMVIVLVAWHIARKDPWRIEPKLYGWMFIEAAGLALPIFSIHLIVYYLVMTLQQQMDGTQLSWLLAEGAKDQYNWQRGMVWSVGAGIYEELLFRLIGVSLLYLLFVKVMQIKTWAGTSLAVGICALLFAFYHFPTNQPVDVRMLLYLIGGGLVGVCVLFLLLVKVFDMEKSVGTVIAVGSCVVGIATYMVWIRGSIDIPTFLFYTAAGAYLGVVYLSRGFGIAVASHALYDAMVVVLTYQTQ